MPFDTSKSQETLNRETLLWHLRNDETVRREWSFTCAYKCAIGVCTDLQLDLYELGLGPEDDPHAPDSPYTKLFRYRGGRAHGYGGIHPSEVTPDMVADAIETEAAKRTNPNG